MAENIVQREYTVHEDEDGREYFLQPQGDNIVLKVYLDEHDRQQSPSPQPQNHPEVLVVPEDQLQQSPPPTRQDDNDDDGDNVQYVYLDNPNPRGNNNNNPNDQVIYVEAPSSNGKLEPVKEEDTQPTIIIVTNQSPQPEEKQPEVIYIQEPPPERKETPEEPKIATTPLEPKVETRPEEPKAVFLQQTPSPSPSPKLRTPKPHKTKSYKSPLPVPKVERKEKPPPKYQPKPQPGQPTTMVGGMLIIDNDPWKPKAKVDHKNQQYIRGGGNVEIMHDRLAWDGRPRVDDWNGNYKRGGGNVVILHENLRWRKNARKIRRDDDPNQTARSFSSENVRATASSPIDTLSEGSPSKSAEPSEATYRNYISPINSKSTYANKYKGKIHRYKGGPQNLPPIDPNYRKVLLRPEDVNKVYPNDEVREIRRPKQKLNPVNDEDESPSWFKRNKKLDNRPAFRLPSKKEPIPSILSNSYDEPPVKKPIHRETQPVRKPEPKVQKFNSKTLNNVSSKKPPPIPAPRLSWKEPKIEKISSKTLDDLSSRRQPASDPVYTDNYGGYYNDEDTNPGDYYYDNMVQRDKPNKQGQKVKRTTQLRNNSKISSVRNPHQQASTRNRNQPVF